MRGFCQWRSFQGLFCLPTFTWPLAYYWLVEQFNVLFHRLKFHEYSIQSNWTNTQAKFPMELNSFRFSSETNLTREIRLIFSSSAFWLRSVSRWPRSNLWYQDNKLNLNFRLRYYKKNWQEMEKRNREIWFLKGDDDIFLLLWLTK